MRGILERRTSRARIVLAGSVAAFSLGAGTAWADGPVVSGTPTAITKDGTSISISGTGFNPSSTIYVMQCSTGTPTGCALGGVKVLTADAAGAVSTTFKVVLGTVGDGKCVAGSTTCFLAVTDGTAANTKAVKLTFPKATTTPTTKPGTKPVTTPVTKPVTTPVTKPVTKPTTTKTTKSTKTTKAATTSLDSGSTSSGTKPPTAVQAGSGGLSHDESSSNLTLALAIGVVGTALAGGSLLQARRGRRSEG